jgi:hypothetical protein
VAEGRLGRQPGTAWQSSRRCPTGDDDRIRKRRTFTCGGCACSLIPFIIVCDVRTFVTRRAAAGAGSFRGTASMYAHYWRGSLSQNELATRISVRGRAELYSSYRYVQLHLQASRAGNANLVAKHARTPRSHSRPHSAPGRLATSVRYRYGIVALKGLEERWGGRSTVPTRSRNANRKITVPRRSGATRRTKPTH